MTKNFVEQLFQFINKILFQHISIAEQSKERIMLGKDHNCMLPFIIAIKKIALLYGSYYNNHKKEILWIIQFLMTFSERS